jgi:hypothetical protein
MATTKYYAFWYNCYFFGERTAYFISEDSEKLLKFFDDYKKKISSYLYFFNNITNKITIDPIECYTYNSKTKTLDEYNDNDIKPDCAFYAVNSFGNNFNLEFYKDVLITIIDTDGNYSTSDDLNKGEILVYLSKTDHNKWNECYNLYKDSKNNFVMDNNYPDFFYTAHTSKDPINENIYYENGII